MDPNQYPPSEREWTIAEMEEFFSSQDALTMNFNYIPQQPPIEWYAGAWNGPLIKLDADDPFGHMERLFSPGIHITSITPPEQGWLLSMYCPICKTTTFQLDIFGIKPTKGDYFLLKGVCCDDKLGARHNMTLALEKEHDFFEFPRKDTFMLQPMNLRPMPYMGSFIEYTTEIPIEEAKKRWPEAFEDKKCD